MTRIRYRDHDITPDVLGWSFFHAEYDGPEDHRCGNEATVAECKAQIDEQIAERLYRNLTWEPTKAAPPPNTYDIATVAAMAAYPLDPGHSDLDNEQPMPITVGVRHFHVPLGDIRQARLLAGSFTRPAVPNPAREGW